MRLYCKYCFEEKPVIPKGITGFFVSTNNYFYLMFSTYNNVFRKLFASFQSVFLTCKNIFQKTLKVFCSFAILTVVVAKGKKTIAFTNAKGGK